MNSVRLQQPRKIIFGEGCVAQCAADLLAQSLRRVFIVTSPPTRLLADTLANALRLQGATITFYDAINAEPSIATFEDVLAAARDAKPDGVVGLGGGSALDVAKLVAALYDGAQDIRDVFGIELLKGRALPMVCLPTTSGTGSEVSPNAILLDESEALKKGVISPYLLPDAAYIDPLLTLSVPPAVTAATGIDALTHCLEAYANKFAHPIVDVYALQGIRLIAANLRRAVENGNDIEARTQVAMGSLYGGLCLAPVNTAAVHALAYPLGGEFHVPHGVSNAVLLPHVLAFNLSACPDRYAAIALAMGVEPGAGDTETAQRGIDRLIALSQECGIPSGLSHFDIPETAIPGLAASAMKVTRLLKNNPRELSLSDAETIYRAAY
jgi:alcohol dehydrogenase